LNGGCVDSLNELIKKTKRVHPKIIQNATEVSVYNLVVKTVKRKSKYTEEPPSDPDEDEKDSKKPEKKFSKVIENIVFTAKASALTDGKTVSWDVVVELFPVEEHFNVYNLPDLNTPCWVKCSCPYFLYFCEYAVAKVGSTEIDYSNGKRPVVRNKNAVAIVCKHLVAASSHVVPAMQKWARTKEKKISFV
jgi:hypothetical protein